MKNNRAKWGLLAFAALTLALAVVFFCRMSFQAGKSAPCISEIMASNHTFPDPDGICCDFIELYNGGTRAADLSGWGLTDSGKTVRYVFPLGTVLEPGEYRTVWCDPDRDDRADLSVNKDKSETIYLVNSSGEAVQTVVTCPMDPDQSMIPGEDGWTLCHTPTPGYPNTEEGAAQLAADRFSCRGSITFSEVLASNSHFYNADNLACDFLELSNSGEAADLSGYTITDGSGSTRYIFPQGTVLEQGSYLVLWCAGENAPDGYAPFSLSREKKLFFALRSPEGTVCDYLICAASEKDLSVIREGDGAWALSARPTPGFSNDEGGYAAYRAAMGYDRCSVQFTEIMSGNTATLAVNGDFPDWLELTNLSDEAVDLENWWLSDSDDPFVFQLHDLVLAPGETKLMICGVDVPFSLSSKGEYLTLSNPLGEPSDSVILPELSPDDSFCLNFTTASWEVTSRPTPGYPNTTEGFTRFCESRQVQGALAISELQSYNDTYLRYAYQTYYDWLELKNVSDAPIVLSDYFLSDSARERNMYRLPEVTLQPGQLFTVLCTGDASLSNSRYTCTNFGLNAVTDTVYIFDLQGNPVDYTRIPSIPRNCSYGRLESGGFGFFRNPTPESPNREGFSMLAPEPVASIPGGSYNDVENGLDVALTADGTIYYTTDGSVPTVYSRRYEAPIHLTKTTVIRSICVCDGMMNSAVATESYFINENHTLPVLSLVSPSEGLFSMESGIYVEGYYTNYYQDWERAANLALYEPGADGASFNIECGLTMFGAGSRSCCAKKSFKVLFNGEYEGPLSYDVFGDGIVTQFSSFALRAGEDYRLGIIRDTLFEDLAMQGCPTLMTQNCRPVILYINGDYWGIYTIKERFTPDYYASHMNVSADSVRVYDAPLGSCELHDIMIQATHANMSNDDWLNSVMERIDIYSLIDWVIMQGYSGNSDIPGNVRYIKSTEGDGLWRWCFYDQDWTYFSSGSFFFPLKEGMQHGLLANGLLRNATFRRMFCQRLAELARTTLSRENVNATIDRLASEIEPEVKRDMARWNLSYNSWKSYIDNMYSLNNNHDRCRELIESLCRMAPVTSAEKKEYFGDLVD